MNICGMNGPGSLLFDNDGKKRSRKELLDPDKMFRFILESTLDIHCSLDPALGGRKSVWEDPQKRDTMIKFRKKMASREDGLSTADPKRTAMVCTRSIINMVFTNYVCVLANYVVTCGRDW